MASRSSAHSWAIASSSPTVVTIRSGSRPHSQRYIVIGLADTCASATWASSGSTTRHADEPRGPQPREPQVVLDLDGDEALARPPHPEHVQLVPQPQREHLVDAVERDLVGDGADLHARGTLDVHAVHRGLVREPSPPEPVVLLIRPPRRARLVLLVRAELREDGLRARPHEVERALPASG